MKSFRIYRIKSLWICILPSSARFCWQFCSLFWKAAIPLPDTGALSFVSNRFDHSRHFGTGDASDLRNPSEAGKIFLSAHDCLSGHSLLLENACGSLLDDCGCCKIHFHYMEDCSGMACDFRILYHRRLWGDCAQLCTSAGILLHGSQMQELKNGGEELQRAT